MKWVGGINNGPPPEAPLKAKQSAACEVFEFSLFFYSYETQFVCLIAYCPKILANRVLTHHSFCKRPCATLETLNFAPVLNHCDVIFSTPLCKAEVVSQPSRDVLQTSTKCAALISHSTARTCRTKITTKKSSPSIPVPSWRHWTVHVASSRRAVTRL